jgi:hypothetical protein
MNGENPAVTPSAGDERVDAAVAGLGQLAGAPVEDHPAVLEEVHRRLGEILASLDEDQR